MSGMSATAITIVLIVYRVLKSVQGKKFVSSCCGRKAEIGFTVRDMAPTPPRTDSENNVRHTVENGSTEVKLEIRDTQESKRTDASGP